VEGLICEHCSVRYLDKCRGSSKDRAKCPMWKAMQDMLKKKTKKEG